MKILKVLRSTWFVRALVLIVSHALAGQFSWNATKTSTRDAEIITVESFVSWDELTDFTSEADAITAGAVITWGGPQNIAGDSDVITGGSLIGAFNVGDGGVSAATVNGVTFNPFALNSTGGPVSSGTVGNFTLATADLFASDNTLYGSTAAPFTNLSAGYRSLLRSATSVSNLVINPATFQLTMAGLVLGHQYKFQWFANTSGPGAQLLSASAGNTVTLNDNVTNAEGGSGQFAVGTFVADALSEVIVFSSVGTGTDAQLNGFQLRDLGLVPEPSGIVLMLLGFGVLACRRTRATAA